jgi:hypothetical protein
LNVGDDAAEFLDVDMHQLTRCGVPIAADHLPGGAVGPGQVVELVADQDPVHRGRAQQQQAGDPGWAPPAQEPDFDDAAFGAGGGGPLTNNRTANGDSERSGLGLPPLVVPMRVGVGRPGSCNGLIAVG